MHEKTIVAVDFGTSKIIAAAAKKNDQGYLSVLAVETVESNGCILRGKILNLEETATKISGLIKTLENRIPGKIEKIYAGVGGQSVHSMEYAVEREFSEETIISDKLLQNILEECLNYEPQDQVVLSATSPEYYVDGRLESKPKGVQCKKIEAKYQIIVGRSSIIKDLETTTEKARISIVGDPLVSSEAVANAVLSSSEKDLGCVLIDFGAGVTTLSCYKNQLLRYLATIPLGSSVITQDLTTLNMTAKEAEDFKIKQGSAVASVDDKTNQVIESRIDEILANVFAQIKHAKFEKMMPEGIIITGGGAKLKNLSESIADRFNCKTRLANAQESMFEKETVLTQSPEYAQISGLLLLGKEDCMKEQVKEIEPEKDLFGEPIESDKKKDDSNKRDKNKKNQQGDKKGPGIVEKWMGKLFTEE